MSSIEKQENCVVISTALPVEYLAVLAHLSKVKEVRHDAGTIYEVGEFAGLNGEWQVVVLQTGQGNPRAALEVERAISFFKPSHVFFIGVAGGLKDVKLGDVVAASKVYGYEYGKASAEFRPRADFGESTYAMIQEATFVARRRDWLSRVRLNSPDDMFGESPRAFVGPIAAGEKVIASTSSNAYQFLKENFSDALAVEMESFGFFRAVHANTNVQALVVRGISDMIDHKSQADALGSQERASAHAAAFMYEVLARAKSAVTPQYIHNEGEKSLGEFWRELEILAVKLYPSGPGQNEVWSRAGGDMSTLTLQSSGKGSWHAALRMLRLGGGGELINPSTLISTMIEDYSTNEELKHLANIYAAQHTRAREKTRAEGLTSLDKDYNDRKTIEEKYESASNTISAGERDQILQQLRVLRIVVASPGDVQAERNKLQDVIEELNRGVAADRRLHLSLSRWETDAYPGFHLDGPQGLIDPILRIENCDILIGIFWKRFGTPTKGSQSGTEHEFKTAYEAWKHNKRPEIMIYFSQKPYTPKSPDEATQWGKVLEFQRGFPQEGLWWPYKNSLAFTELVRNHLTQFIRARFPISTVEKARQPSGAPILHVLVCDPNPTQASELIGDIKLQKEFVKDGYGPIPPDNILDFILSG